MDSKARLAELCQNALVVKDLDTVVLRERLSDELRHIDGQNENDYFLDLYDSEAKYPENEHNLVVPYLLDIVPDFNIDQPSASTFGDFPDADIDYLKEVRDYLKNEWAPKTYGQSYVCNIGSYNTFGIKSSLIDMARVFSKSRQEILDLTTKIGLKDEDGKAITWDKALEMYPELNKYCEENKDVAAAAKKLLHRNRGMGKHAGGLIVSSVPIDQFVPLVIDKDGMPASAWVEGLHGQDLGPMGLVKFDLLVITNLMQIAVGCKLIKERHGLTSICALPGQKDWSDTSYLEDPKALKLADKGDLKCIFQFDSDGIRKMVRDGGVTCFDDLMGYAALYRPGPLQSKMDKSYINRKRGKESYTLHPVLQPILGNTYGVMIYQEQVMQILNVVGLIPLKDCEIVRKAISKKKRESFEKYERMFIENGQKILGWTEEEVKKLWDQIGFFSEYGFNKSHCCAYTYVSSRLLWIKAHYPLEFFAAILSCEKQAEKIKEYKLEADRFGINVKPLTLNKSKAKFAIVDNEIYFGFSNVKGIGEAVAERIVQNQSYNNLEDFLTKFGTDASVMKPLIGLRIFGDDILNVYRYYEWFKDIKNKKDNAQKRFEKTSQERLETLKSLLPESLHHLAVFTNENLDKIKEANLLQNAEWHQKHIDKINQEYQQLCVELQEELKEYLPKSLHHLAVFTDESFNHLKEILDIENGPCPKSDEWTMGEDPELDAMIQWQDEDGMNYYLFDSIERLFKKYVRENKKHKQLLAIEDPLFEEIKDLFKQQFNAVENREKKLLKEIPVQFNDEFQADMSEELYAVYNSLEASEKAYYGFLWNHPLERSPDYENQTFESFRTEELNVGPVEVRVESVEEKESKKKTKYWLLQVEDSNSEMQYVQVWEDDYKIFKDELIVGDLLRIRVKAPDGGFSRYTLDSPPRHKRHLLPKDKSLDYRVVTMRKGVDK